MPNFNYTNGLPNPPNLPSQDVNDMQINCNSVEDIWDEDHFGFNDNNGGFHQQVSLLNQAAPGIPAGLSGVLYADANGGNSWPIWQNALGSFQITGSASPNNPSVGGANGWTFLPGGFILQWGTTPVGAISGSVLFNAANIDFPANCYNVQATPIFITASPPLTPTNQATVSVDALTTTGFNWRFNQNTFHWNGFFWIAIGN